MSRARTRSAGYMASSSPYLGGSSSYALEQSANNYSSYYNHHPSLNSPTSYSTANATNPASSYASKSRLYNTSSSYGSSRMIPAHDDFLFDSLKSPPPVGSLGLDTSMSGYKSSPRLFRSARSHPELPITEITPPTPASPRDDSPPPHISALLNGGYSNTITTSAARPIKNTSDHFESSLRSRSLEPDYGRNGYGGGYYTQHASPYRDSNNDYQQQHYPPLHNSMMMMGSNNYYDALPPSSSSLPLSNTRPAAAFRSYRISDAYRDPPGTSTYREDPSPEPTSSSHTHHHHHRPSRREHDCCAYAKDRRCSSPTHRKTTNSCSYNDDVDKPASTSHTCNHHSQEEEEEDQGQPTEAKCSSAKSIRKKSATVIRESTHKQHESSSAPAPPKERSVILSFEKYQSPYATINRVANSGIADFEDEEEEELLLAHHRAAASKARSRSNRSSLGGLREIKLKSSVGASSIPSKRDRRKTLAYGVSARDLMTTMTSATKVASPASRLRIPKLVEHYDLALQKDSLDLLHEEEPDIMFRAFSPELALTTATLKQQGSSLHNHPSLTLASLEREVNGLKVAAEEDEKLIVLRKDDLNSLLTAKPTLLIGKELNISGDSAKNTGVGGSSSGGIGGQQQQHSSSANKFLHPNNAQLQAANHHQHSSSYHNKSMDKDNSHNGDIDYKKLWEESQLENSRLREELSKSEDTRGRLEGALNSASKTTISEADKREKRALEKKLSEMEEELKQIEHLKNEIQRLRDENGALIRVISKLSK